MKTNKSYFIIPLLILSLSSLDFMLEDKKISENMPYDVVDSIQVKARYYCEYFKHPTSDVFRTLDSFDTNFRVYKNDSILVIESEYGTGKTEIILGYEADVFEKFLNLANNIGTVEDTLEYAYGTFLGSFLIDFYFNGKIVNSIFVNDRGEFMIEGKVEVLFSKKLLLALKEIFPSYYN